MTAADFKAAFPEFSNTSALLIEAEIEVAEVMCPASIWTDETKRERGIGLTVAQSLALGPAGRDMQLAPDGSTVYDGRLDELRRQVAGGPRAV